MAAKRKYSKNEEVGQRSPAAPIAVAGIQFERGSNFCSSYANNVRFESTVYDLKLIFGQSEQKDGKEVIVQHTAITVPWAAIKAGLYYLDLNILFHELYNGKITIPPSQLPPPFPEPPAEIRAIDPKAEEACDLANQLRETFLSRT